MVEKTSHFHGYFLRIWILLSMNNNFLGIRGLYKTHMDGLKPFNSKSVTYTYIGYTEHNSRGQPIVRPHGSQGCQKITFFYKWNCFPFPFKHKKYKKNPPNTYLYSKTIPFFPGKHNVSVLTKINCVRKMNRIWMK